MSEDGCGVTITATRVGLRPAQYEALRALLLDLFPTGHGVLRHGDCVGGDADANMLAMAYLPSVWRHAYPAKVARQWLANCEVDQREPPAPPLARNRTMVDASAVVVGAPETAAEQLRSGTWSTLRYATKQGKRVFIINPDGSVIRREPSPLPMSEPGSE